MSQGRERLQIKHRTQSAIKFSLGVEKSINIKSPSPVKKTKQNICLPNSQCTQQADQTTHFFLPQNVRNTALLLLRLKTPKYRTTLSVTNDDANIKRKEKTVLLSISRDQMRYKSNLDPCV